MVYNVPCYVLPLYVLLLCVSMVGLSLLWIRYRRCATVGLVAFIVLLMWSQFYTIDPVSKIIFGTFKFGTHEMLLTGGFRKLPAHGGPVYIGNNQLVYNFQFIKLGELAEQAVREFGYDRKYIVGPAFNWQDDFSRYDKRSGRRTMQEESIVIDFKPMEQASLAVKQGKEASLVYLEFPNVLNDESLALLNNQYAVQSSHSISKDGYAIRAHEFSNRISNYGKSDIATDRSESNQTSLQDSK
jgi:hypothetical protein